MSNNTADKCALFSDELYVPHKLYQTKPQDGNDVHTIVGDKLDRKLITLTQLHFEITEISKTVNQMFSFQMLILMVIWHMVF